MTHAEKYLNDFADLQKEYGTVEITFEGLCEHLERFAYYEQKRVKKLNIDDVSKSLPNGCKHLNVANGICEWCSSAVISTNVC